MHLVYWWIHITKVYHGLQDVYPKLRAAWSISNQFDPHHLGSGQEKEARGIHVDPWLLPQRWQTKDKNSIKQINIFSCYAKISLSSKYRILGECLRILSVPGRALRMHVELRGLPSDSTCVLEALPGKLVIKRRKPSILFISLQAN